MFQLNTEMEALDSLARNLFGRVAGYYKEQLVDGGKLAAQASHLFWQLSEREFQSLVDNCDQSESSMLQRQRLRRRFAAHVHSAYDHYCPKETARQLEAWAKCRPNNSNYLKQEA